MKPKLITLLGPTGVGKTELALALAEHLDTEIISADSRQVYREIPIGTAAPSLSQQKRVPHHLVGNKSIQEYYSVSLFEQDVLSLLPDLFCRSGYALMSGGSMMYIDAVANGIDEIPDVRSDIRQSVYATYEAEGLERIWADLQRLDPIYASKVDPQNYKRVLHGYEVCLSTGRPFSSFHTGKHRERSFQMTKIGLYRERAELYERINERVLNMMEQGLEAEARAAYPYRQLNALNTVGYKELFSYFDGQIDLEEAIRKIQSNSRQYARKQMTWWRRDDSITWFHPEETEKIQAYIQRIINE